MELFYKLIAGLLAILIYRFLTSKNLEEMLDLKTSGGCSIYSMLQDILVVFLTCHFFFDSANKNNEPVVEPVVEHTVNRVVERAKCRDIVVEDEEVKIKFLNGEDAEIFAGDLKNLLNEKE